jgi:hypothetical protein
MNVKLDVLGPLVVDGVVGEVDRRDVVAKDDARLVHGKMQLTEKVPEPATFRRGVGYPAVLGLR